jgi:hypothetical protein
MYNPIFSDSGRAMMAEQNRFPNPMQQPSPAQSAGLVSLDSLLKMQAQINYLKSKLPPAQPPQGTVAQDMERQLGQIEGGISSLPAENVGNERAYATGGIVAFAGPTGSEVKADTPQWTDEDENELGAAEDNLKKAMSEQYALGPYGGVSYADPQLKMVQRELQDKVSALRRRKQAVQQSGRLGEYRSRFGLPAVAGEAAPTSAAGQPTAPQASALTAAELNRILGRGSAPSYGGAGTSAYDSTIQSELENLRTAREKAEPKDLAAYRKDISESRGPNKYLEAYEKSIEEDRTANAADIEERRAAAKGAAWATGLQAVSRPGQAGSAFNQLLAALGETSAAYQKAIPAIKDKEAELRKQIRNDQLNIAKARRDEDVELDRDSRAELQRHTEMYNNLNNNVRALVIGEAQAKRGEQAADLRFQAQMRREDEGVKGLERDYANLSRAYNLTKDPRLLPEIEKTENSIRNLQMAHGAPALAVNQARISAKQYSDAEKAVRKSLELDAAYNNLKSPEAREQYFNAEMDRALARMPTGAGFTVTGR